MSTPSHPSAHPAPKRGLPTWGIIAIAAGGLAVLCCIGLVAVVVIGGDAAREGFEDGLDGQATAEASPSASPPPSSAPAEPSPTPTEVPVLTIPEDLVGLNAAIVEDQLRDLGFTRIDFGSVDADDTLVLVPANWTVVEVEPEPGDEVRADTLIVLRCTKQE